MPIMDPGFYKKLLEVSNDVQMKPEDLLNVMAVESGINPTAHNNNGNASGLLQFMPKTLKNLGYQGSHGDFRSLSGIEQLDWVKKLIQSNMKFNGGPFTSAAQYYVANFLPVALKLPGIKENDPNTIIVAKYPEKPHLPGVNVKQESLYYKSNSGLDADKDGAISFGDIQTVLNRAAGGKNFRSAIAQLQSATGYQPDKSSMVAVKSPSSNTIKDTNVFDILDKYLHQVAATDRATTKIYKKILPNQDILIQVYANDETDAIEFSRILTSALDEELSAGSFIHIGNHKVEIECNIVGPSKDCFETVKELTAAIADAFEIATKKIGGIRVKTNCIMNKRSSYREIDLKTANLQYRKFLLKFI